jgi:hypothetical protein
VKPLLLGASLALASSVAHGFCRTTLTPAQPDPTVCPRGTPVAWPLACVGLRVDPTVLPTLPEVITAEQFGAAVETAMQTWAGADCGGGQPPSFRLVRLADAPGARIGYNLSGANDNVIRFSTTWNNDSFHPPDAAAVTIVTFGASSARILDADTEINLRAPTNPNGAQFSLQGLTFASDLLTVITHELGHTLGLAHASLPSSVMWFTAGRGEQRRALTPDDTAGVCAVYPPRADVLCDPNLRSISYSGGGCQSVTGNVHGSLASCAFALTLLGRRRRRRVL